MKHGLLSYMLFLLMYHAMAQTYNLDTSFANKGMFSLAPHQKGNYDYERGDGLVQLPDGKMLLTVNNNRTYVRRLLPNGQPDSSFANFSISDEYPIWQSRLLRLPDGHILLVGIENRVRPYQIRVFRLLADGLPDSTFNANGFAHTVIPNHGVSETIQDLLLHPDGKVSVYLATAKSTSPKSKTQVLRLYANGSADKSFGTNGWYLVPGGPNSIPAGVALSGQRLIVAYLNYERFNEYTLMGLNQHGQLDPAFGDQGKVVIPMVPNEQSAWISALPDGRIVAGGKLFYSNPTYYVYRLHPNGVIDSSFGFQGRATLNNAGYPYEGKSVLADPQKGVRVISVQYNPSLTFQVSRMDSTGLPDLAFGNWGSAYPELQGVYILNGETQVSADGSMYLTGSMSSTSNMDYFIVRLKPDGQVDELLGEQGAASGHLPSIRASFGFLRSNRNGDIYVRYMPEQASTLGGFLKVNCAGVIDSLFGKKGLAVSEHSYFDTLSENRLISIAYKFNPDNSAAYTNISRFTSKGLPDSNFGIDGTLTLTIKPGFHPSQVRTVNGDKLAIIGSYSKNNQSFNSYGIAWYQSNGQPDKTMGDQGFTELPITQFSIIYLMVPLADGSLLVGGLSGNLDNSQYVVFHVLSSGQLDTQFGNNGVLTNNNTLNTTLNAILPQPDGSIVVAYYHLEPNQVTYLARFTADGKPHPDYQSPGPLLFNLPSFLVSETGHIIILSNPTTENPNDAFIYRFNPNCSLDSAYGSQGRSLMSVKPGSFFYSGSVVGRQLYFVGQHNTNFVTKALLARLTNEVPQPVVSNFTLINATSDKDLQTLTNGATFNIAAIRGKRINIRANTTGAGSVVLQLSGQQQRTQTESELPYALFGNTGNNYWNWTPAAGNYTLTATPYSGTKATGTAGTPVTIQFTITDELTLSGLTLINATTNRAIRPLANGAVIDLAQTPAISMRANTGVGYTESVRFGVNDTTTIRMENAPPFAIAGDNLGDYNNWIVTPGNYTITATPYSYNNGGGTAGTPLTLSIKVVNSNPRGTLAAAGRQPELNATNLQVYPNPALGQATLSFTASAAGNTRIWISNASGNRVQELRLANLQKGESRQVPLDLSKLPKGMYTISVGEGSNNQVVQVIKQ